MRHPMAPPQGACGRGCAPVPNSVRGEDCLSEASSAALTFGTGAKAPEGPRPGAHGFGSFCRNKRTSAWRGRNPAKFLPLGRAGRNPAKPSPLRRAGPKPRILHVPFLSSSTIVIENPVSVALRTKEKEKALDPRSGSGMTDKRRKTAREGADVGQKARTEVRRPAGRPVVTTA